MRDLLKKDSTLEIVSSYLLVAGSRFRDFDIVFREALNPRGLYLYKGDKILSREVALLASFFLLAIASDYTSIIITIIRLD